MHEYNVNHKKLVTGIWTITGQLFAYNELFYVLKLRSSFTYKHET